MPAPPLILFGAFDRHNFGDLLLGEIAQALFAARKTIFAGLAERDLRALGGRRVRAVGALARELGDTPVDVLHVGGEILSCSLYEAAVMLQNESEARQAIARYDRDPAARAAWVAKIIGLNQPVAYLVPHRLFRNTRWLGFMGIGGADWAKLPSAMREYLLPELKHADHIWLRDRATHAALAQHGIDAQLAPDPAVLTRQLFAILIEARTNQGEVLAARKHFPAGYLALQFSGDFGDDATLNVLGQQLKKINALTGYGWVLFRAGAAPWHDDLEVYQRLVSRLAEPDVVIFRSLELWDICALLAASRGFVGSSLHARIVAEAFGKPAVSLALADVYPDKLASYLDTWWDGAASGLATPATLAATFALARHNEARQRAQLAAMQEALAALCQSLGD